MPQADLGQEPTGSAPDADTSVENGIAGSPTLTASAAVARSPDIEGTGLMQDLRNGVAILRLRGRAEPLATALRFLVRYATAAVEIGINKALRESGRRCQRG